MLRSFGFPGLQIVSFVHDHKLEVQFLKKSAKFPSKTVRYYVILDARTIELLILFDNNLDMMALNLIWADPL